jgi:hypothetical protein
VLILPLERTKKAKKVYAKTKNTEKETKPDNMISGTVPEKNKPQIRKNDPDKMIEMYR